MVLLRARFIVTPKIALRAVVSYTAVSPLLTEVSGLFSVTLRCERSFDRSLICHSPILIG